MRSVVRRCSPEASAYLDNSEIAAQEIVLGKAFEELVDHIVKNKQLVCPAANCKLRADCKNIVGGSTYEARGIFGTWQEEYGPGIDIEVSCKLLCKDRRATDRTAEEISEISNETVDRAIVFRERFFEKVLASDESTKIKAEEEFPDLLQVLYKEIRAEFFAN